MRGFSSYVSKQCSLSSRCPIQDPAYLIYGFILEIKLPSVTQRLKENRLSCVIRDFGMEQYFKVLLFICSFVLLVVFLTLAIQFINFLTEIKIVVLHLVIQFQDNVKVNCI